MCPMEKGQEIEAPTSPSRLETVVPATTLFIVGTPLKSSSTKNINQPTNLRTLSRSKFPHSEGGKPKSRPVVYGAARSKPKPNNTPIAQCLPLAFPVGSNFTFNVPNVEINCVSTTRKNSTRALHALPTDVLVLVIQSIEPSRHHRVLKVLSLVSRGLNAAIAPILYRHLRLFHLKEVYDFSLGFRHPASVMSLEMFLTPDPQDSKWSPPSTNWVERLMGTLSKMEGLVSLNIKRCKNSAILDAITRHSNNPNFLPALQKVSLGYSYQFMCFAAGRSITCYGLAFDIQDPSGYESLDRFLFMLKLSSKSGKDRTQHRSLFSVSTYPGSKNSVPKNPGVGQRKVTDVLSLIPHKMPNLSHLELFDLRSPEYHPDATMKIANELSANEGLCPGLALLGLDGLLWKRTRDSPSPQQIAAELSRLISNERDKNAQSKENCGSVSLPEVTWIPCPSSPRGLKWWANKAQALFPSSRTKAIFLLREWMLNYWDPARVPSDDGRLERAVPHW
ncbi:hypothetical protein RHS01_03620 [Rhizoctonia solani]|uniref:F-box domain-containing protein n=1 Tax=Rhizoctonia solani TaxID=456999 RepID=A0A8H7M8G1_9AGAM|nr:hypothetical protein RHS01_03620 [Rhizoctonia solani]